MQQSIRMVRAVRTSANPQESIMLKRASFLSLIAGLSLANAAFAAVPDSWTELDPRVRAQEEKQYRAAPAAQFKAPVGTRYDVIDRNSPL